MKLISLKITSKLDMNIKFQWYEEINMKVSI